MTWLDQTVRTEGVADVALQPDDTVELSWPIAELGSSRVTVIMSVVAFTALLEKGRDLLMIGAVGVPT